MNEQASAEDLSSDVVQNIENALSSVPVKGCHRSKSGGLVIKFPNRETRDEESSLIGSSLVDNTSVTISEPKKLLPKMTLLDVPLSLPDDDIIPGIKSKNTAIRRLLEDGSTLTLLFTRTKAGKKTTVS